MKKAITYNNGSMEEVLKAIEGNTIITTMPCTDATGEGFMIETRKKIGDVTIGQNITREEGEYFLSEEFVLEK